MIGWTPGWTLDAVEKATIQQAFKYFKENKTQTASALGIAIRTLDNKLEKYADDDRQAADAEAQRVREREERNLRARGQVVGAAPTGGLLVESVTPIAAESSMPVSERLEVQKVLQRQATKSRPSTSR